MFPSEKRSLYRFLFIYIGSTLLLFTIGSSIFYSYEKHRLIDEQNTLLKAQSTTLFSELKQLHSSQNNELIYPQHSEFHSAIYDIDSNYLFGDFHPNIVDFKNEFWQKDEMLFYLQKISPYYLGAAYIVTRKPIDPTPINMLQMQLITAFLIAIVFISLIAYWLGHLFLAPMRHSITLLDDFTKDATHELNTPVSTILANAELLKSYYSELENSKELQRIETASKRLSQIYDDLAYLRLNHQRHRVVEAVDIATFVQERLEYFQSIADAKQIHLWHNISKGVSLCIDKEDLTRIVDNLLGNAFKYTPSGGSVNVTLNKECLSIEDTGIGIDDAAKKEVLQRFVRANKSEGGFGLGLSIVADIAKHYGFNLKLQSEPNKGTKVSILWEK